MNNTIDTLQSEVNQKTLTGFAFHTKFFAILGIISGAFSCLLGLPLLLVFGLGIIYIGIGAGLIYLSIQLLKTSAIAKSISTTIGSDEEITQEDLNQKMMSIISGIKFQFKVYNILVMIQIGLIVLLVVFGIIASFSMGSSFNSSMMMNGNIDSQLMNQNYRGKYYNDPTMQGYNQAIQNPKTFNNNNNFAPDYDMN